MLHDIRNMQQDLARGRDHLMEAKQRMQRCLGRSTMSTAWSDDLAFVRDRIDDALVATGNLRHRLELHEQLAVVRRVEGVYADPEAPTGFHHVDAPITASRQPERMEATPGEEELGPSHDCEPGVLLRAARRTERGH